MTERTGTSILSFSNCAPICSLRITDKWPPNAKATAVYISYIQNNGINVSRIELTFGMLRWTMFRGSDGYIADLTHRQLLTPIDAEGPWSWGLEITPIGEFVPGTSISVSVALVWSLHVLPPVPVRPYGLSASQDIISSRFKIHVYWMVSSAEDSSYTLERARSGDDFRPIAEVKALKPSTQGGGYADFIDSPHLGEQIRYRVKAHNEAGDSPYSDVLTVRISGFSVPDAPYGLSASIKAQGNNALSVHVFWMVSSRGDQGYTLERSRGGEAFKFSSWVPALTPSTRGANCYDRVADSYLGEHIKYRVSAHNAFGDSAFSELLTVTVDAASFPVPSVPYGLSASKKALSADTVEIHVYWMVSSTGDQSYILERSRGGAPFVKVADVAALIPSTQGNSRVDTVSGTFQGEQIQYRVKAHNQFGDSAYSEVLVLTIDRFPVPAVPFGLSASKTAVGNNIVEAHVYWMVSSTGDQSYTLERSRGSAPFVKVADVAALIPSTQGNNRVDTVSGTFQGEQIQYRVKAHNKFGVSGYSDILTVSIDYAALPVPAAPYGLSAAKKWIGRNRIEVRVYWLVTSLGDSDYVVERATNDGGFVQVANVRALVPSTRGANCLDTVPNIHSGAILQYRVRGHNQFGYGQYSETLAVTV